jgi:tetratricopeptide (TPR) repeat protein
VSDFQAVAAHCRVGGGASALVAALLKRAEDQLREGELRGAWRDFAAAIAVDATPASRYAWGVALAERGYVDAALLHLEAACDVARSNGAPLWRARCCHALADVHRAAGRRDLANRYRQWGLRAELDAAGEIDPTTWLQDRVSEALALGKLTEAEQGIQALERLTRGAPEARGMLLMSRGMLRLRQQRWSGGLRHFVAAFHAFRQEGDPVGCAHAVLSVGHLLQARGSWRRARICFAQAARLLRRLGADSLRRQAEQFQKECHRLEAAACGDPRRN